MDAASADPLKIGQMRHGGSGRRQSQKEWRRANEHIGRITDRPGSAGAAVRRFPRRAAPDGVKAKTKTSESRKGKIMNIYIYRLHLRSCPSLWTAWAVRADSKEEAAQWHNWTGAPKHDSAVLVGEIKQ